MELTRKSCRICLSESEFNVSLFGSYCRRTNMVDKILVCLKLVIEDTEKLNTICYKCAESIERYYDFIMFIKKCQMRLAEPRTHDASVNRRHVTSYVREEVINDSANYRNDYTFSFLENHEEIKQPKASSPFFSYFSPPSVVKKVSEHMWKTPRDVDKHEMRFDKFSEGKGRARRHSRDIFESQSQDEPEPRSFDWKLTPDNNNIMKRVRDKCFGRSDL